MVTANTSYNCGKALLGRMFLGLPERPWGAGPYPGIWKHVEQFKDLLLPHLDSQSMTFDAWLASMPARRRKPLLSGFKRLERTGWLSSYEKFSSFLKTELLPGFDKLDGELIELKEMLDRLINGPSEEAHCVAGKHLKPKVKELKKRWHCEFPIFYGSTGPEALYKWLQRIVDARYQYFWCDFSMFDRTHSDQSWDFMEGFYRDIDDPLFWTVMRAWRRPKGSIGPFKYNGPTINASGRDDTALVNGVLNGFATFLSATAAYLSKDVLELTRADVHVGMKEIKLSVCGDDSLGAVPWMPEARMAMFRTLFNQSIEKFGFVAKLCTSDTLEDAVYLAMRPYPTKKGWFWGKTIGRASYKMGWVMNRDQDVMAHVTGIADAHVLCSSHVPVLSDLAEKIVELRQGAKRTPVQMDANRPWEWAFQSGVKYDELTLASVARAYSTRDTPGNPRDWERDVSVQDVKDLIGEIKKIERLPAVIDHWLWKHMVYADDL